MIYFSLKAQCHKILERGDENNENDIGFHVRFCEIRSVYFYEGPVMVLTFWDVVPEVIKL